MSQPSFRSLAMAMMPMLTIAAIVGFVLLGSSHAEVVDPPRAAPEFTQQNPAAWINSKPLTLEHLRGHVVLLDFWAFDCWNCYRSFPWLKGIETEFQDRGLRVIGIHTPELAEEKITANVVDKVKEYGLHYPVMIDNEYAYWNAMHNRFWPTYYLLDKQGRIRAVFIGETHAGDAQANAVEEAIEKLLAENA